MSQGSIVGATASSPASGPARGEKAATARKRLTILGATGSIGRSTLDLIAHHPDGFEIVAITAQSSVAELAKAARQTNARLAVIGDPELYGELKGLLAGTATKSPPGPLPSLPPPRSPPTACWRRSSARQGSSRRSRRRGRAGALALANKECLVSAGEVFMSAVAEAGTELLPVDSEHSAALQALAGAEPESIETIVLTASGGPFRTWSAERLARATPAEALRHPNWSMGAKISIDSATLMNKSLELIEAYHLFPVRADQLGIVVHPQSIVHCLVSYTDGSVLAQLSSPDMRTPIALALSWPRRMATPTRRLDLVALGSLTFEAPDEVRFPALRLGREALRLGGTAPAVLNAANEIAVEAFLKGAIGFCAIADVTAATLEAAGARGLMAPAAGLTDILAVDAEARRLAQSLLSRYV